MKTLIIEPKSKYSFNVNEGVETSMILRNVTTIHDVIDGDNEKYKYEFHKYTGKLTILEKFDKNLIIIYE